VSTTAVAYSKLPSRPDSAFMTLSAQNHRPACWLVRERVDPSEYVVAVDQQQIVVAPVRCLRAGLVVLRPDPMERHGVLRRRL
jgi:hypothetical protein